MARSRAASSVARAVRAERQIRADDAQHDVPAYKPVSALDAPPARPGMRQRWVRTMMLGQPDPTNVHKRFREGWVPRPADTIPEGFDVPTVNHGKHGNVIGIEGLILCEMPLSRVAARNKYYADKAKGAMTFVNATLGKVARGDVPITVEHKSKTKVGEQIIDQDED